MKLILDILEELKSIASDIDRVQVNTLCDRIVAANRIYVVGRGRSGLIVKMFAMRLMHIGLTVYAVDEVVTPAINARDLLIICSGSGETASLKAMVDKAKANGAHVELITANADSYIAHRADDCIVVNGYTPKNTVNLSKSIQPMGSQFEQLMLFILESTIIMLKDRLGVSEEDMMACHANLE